MTSSGKTAFFCRSALAFAGIPLLIRVLEDGHGRGLIQETLSILAVLTLCQMIVLCFWSRAHALATKCLTWPTRVRWHKRIGYACVGIMLFHPLMPIAHTLLEPGISPTDAFVTMITTFNRGVILGISAWCSMLLLGVTALTRSRLPMRYTTWQIFHGTLAMVFIILAVWHVVDLGGHAATPPMVLYISLLAASSVLLVASRYLKHPGNPSGDHK